MDERSPMSALAILDRGILDRPVDELAELIARGRKPGRRPPRIEVASDVLDLDAALLPSIDREP